MIKKKYQKVVILFIIPLIIFCFVLSPSYSKVVRLPNSDTWIIKEESPSYVSVLKNILEVPFSLKWYNICFSDKNTTTESHHYSDPIMIEVDHSPDITLEITRYGCSHTIEINKGDEYCILVNLKEDFNFRWHLESSFNINETTKNKSVNLIVKPGYETRFVPDKWGLLAKLILVVLAWFGIVLLINGVKDFIKK